MKASRNFTIVSTIILSVFAFAPGAGAVLLVNELSGSFGLIRVDPVGGNYFEMDNGTVSQTEPSNVDGLIITPLQVDVTGYVGAGGSVAITGGTVTIQNPANATTAVLDVDFATLTQVMVDPIGIGYMELNMTLASNDLIFAGEQITLSSNWQAVISYTGLVVEPGGINGPASLNALGQASFSAIPEPATLVLLLGGLAFLRTLRQ